MSKLKYLALISFSLTFGSDAIAQNWSKFPCTSINFPVSHLVADGNTLYCAGSSPSSIVSYDQQTGCQQINPLPDPQMDIRSMIVYNGDLIVSGYSFDTTRIYRKSGGGWVSIGSSYQSIINAMIVYNNELYIGGLIYEINGVMYEGVAKWNGTLWSNPGGITGGIGMARVRSFCIYNGELYAGGDGFAPTANDVAKYSGGTWVPVGTGVTGAPYPTVFAMKEYNGSLYVAGTFDMAGTTPVNNIARWNGSTWSSPGSGIGGGDSLIIDLEVFNNELYASGSFTDPGINIAKFNGSFWSALSGGGLLTGGVAALATYGNSLIAGGGFSWNQNGTLIENIARYSTCSSTINASGPTTLCSGNSVILSAPAGITYQWQKGSINISGANAQTYTAAQTGTYSCIITTTCGVIPSNSITVIVQPTPAATITAAGPLTFCAGDSVKLNANTGLGYTYQWFKYGNAVPGATASFLVAKSNGSYKVQVTSSALCSKKSAATIVSVNPLPSASITAASSTSICAGDSVMLNATTNTPGSTYQWKKYSNFIAGASGSSYAAKTTGKYKAVVTSPAGCVRASNAINVTVVCREMQPSSQFEMQLAPNPATDKITIHINESEPVTLSITDVTGALKWVQENTFTEQQLDIDISNLAPGIYFMQVRSAKGVEAMKFIRQGN